MNASTFVCAPYSMCVKKKKKVKSFLLSSLSNTAMQEFYYSHVILTAT